MRFPQILKYVVVSNKFWTFSIWVVKQLRRGGETIFQLANKLQLLKKDIKMWNKEVFGRVEVKMREIIIEVEELDSLEVERELDEENEKKKMLKVELASLALAEETSWRQRSKALWLEEGDSKNSFTG